ncbi:tail fiber assembly protein [Pectobacterium phage vB_PcaM_CBB]|uniref:Tail fiber assembly protein n=1 Tax=Pectobacterium phage vB_PcaM_CBB TaxID=2772511 RepID=A0A1L2CUX5_9CAUD|nr:tail fiber assembly protein [Pectobacterium phage vB_PcaM_CBB]AMM43825.1 tail fiber assembly protein [Pectobacterium phage vB_PcaM_CBB]
MFKRYEKPGGYTNVQYWIDENGTDWYDYADNATLDNLKVLVDVNNIVVGFHMDATTLTPTDATLYEVTLDKVPEDLQLVKYSYDGDKFYLTEFPDSGQSIDDIKNELFMLMLKTKMTTEEKKYFEELKELLLQKLSK